MVEQRVQGVTRKRKQTHEFTEQNPGIDTCGTCGRSRREHRIGRLGEVKTCSICQLPYTGWGNNAWPVNEGRCCNNCNSAVVIVARLNQITAARATRYKA